MLTWLWFSDPNVSCVVPRRPESRWLPPPPPHSPDTHLKRRPPPHAPFFRRHVEGHAAHAPAHLSPDLTLVGGRLNDHIVHEEDDGIRASDPQTHVHIAHHSFIEAALIHQSHISADDAAVDAMGEEMKESPLQFSRGGAPDVPAANAAHGHHAAPAVESIAEVASNEEDLADEVDEDESNADGSTAATATAVGKKYRGLGALKGKGGGRAGLPKPLSRTQSQRAAIESTAPSSSAGDAGEQVTTDNGGHHHAAPPLRVTQSREYEGGVIVEDLEEDDDDENSSLAHEDFDTSAGRVIEMLGAGSGLSGGHANRGGGALGRGKEGTRGAGRATPTMADVSDPPETFDFSAAAPARLEMLRALVASGPAAAKELVPRDNLNAAGSSGWVASVMDASVFSADWVLNAVGLGIVPRKVRATVDAASVALHKPFFSSADVAETTATLGAFACVACAIGAVALAAKRGYL